MLVDEGKVISIQDSREEYIYVQGVFVCSWCVCEFVRECACVCASNLTLLAFVALGILSLCLSVCLSGRFVIQC